MRDQAHTRFFFALTFCFSLAACSLSVDASTPTPPPAKLPASAADDPPSLAVPTSMPGIEQVPNVDIDALITLQTPEDIEDRRDELIEFIFGHPSIPQLEFSLNTYQPDERTQAHLELWQDANPDFLTLTMDYGLVSNIILLHADHPGDTLILYHTGHGGLVQGDQENVLRLLEAGYDVLFISLPLTGINNPFSPNPTAIAQTDCCGEIKFISGVNGHAQFEQLDRPLKYFFEPLAAAVYFAEMAGYQRVAMIGISGGGWAAVVYSAIDPRISLSFPVAASLPLWMRIPDYEQGDFEQNYAPFYQMAGYLDLYLMGAYGEDRSQLQIFNYYDPCCYGGDRATVFLDPIQSRLDSLGAGAFSIYIDRGHTTHWISPEAVDIILAALAAE